jgi:hypothetical protein
MSTAAGKIKTVYSQITAGYSSVQCRNEKVAAILCESTVVKQGI